MDNLFTFLSNFNKSQLNINKPNPPHLRSTHIGLLNVLQGAGIVLYAGWVERGIVNPDEKEILDFK